MARRVTITPELKTQLTQLIGDANANIDNLVVFELVNVTSRPIQKAGSVYDGGVVTKGLMAEAAAWLNAGGYVPFITLHDMWNEDLPAGRLFNASVTQADDGNYELRSMVYLDQTVSPDLVARLDSGILENVSIGLKSKHLNCSECGWDYNSDPTGDALFWDRTCENGHALGYGTYHLVMEGLDKWIETSLVPQGASDGAKIQKQVQQRLAANSDPYKQLAAQGSLEIKKILFAMTAQNEDIDMKPEDIQKMIDEGLKATRTELNTAITNLNSSKELVVELTAKLETSSNTVAELSTKLEASATALAESKAALEAATTENTKTAEKVSTLEASLMEANQKLATLATSAPREAIAPNVAVFAQQIKVGGDKGIQSQPTLEASGQSESQAAVNSCFRRQA